MWVRWVLDKDGDLWKQHQIKYQPSDIEGICRYLKYEKIDGPQFDLMGESELLELGFYRNSIILVKNLFYKFVKGYGDSNKELYIGPERSRNTSHSANNINQNK
eukprot:UN28926